MRLSGTFGCKEELVGADENQEFRITEEEP